MLLTNKDLIGNDADSVDFTLTALGLLVPQIRTAGKLKRVVSALIKYIKKNGAKGLKILQGLSLRGGKKLLEKVFSGAKKGADIGIDVFDDLPASTWDNAGGIVDSIGKGEWGNVFNSGLKPGDLIKNGNSGKILKRLKKNKGIPKDWIASKTTRKQKNGITFHKPGSNKADEVRIMPGRSTSPHSTSKQPYVRWKKDGKWLDKNGVPTNDPSRSHIPVDDFNFKLLE